VQEGFAFNLTDCAGFLTPAAVRRMQLEHGVLGTGYVCPSPLPTSTGGTRYLLDLPMYKMPPDGRHGVSLTGRSTLRDFLGEHHSRETKYTSMPKIGTAQKARPIAKY
jgi:hypothetical protein